MERELPQQMTHVVTLTTPYSRAKARHFYSLGDGYANPKTSQEA
jgi:hypothetical protein